MEKKIQRERETRENIQQTAHSNTPVLKIREDDQFQ